MLISNLRIFKEEICISNHLYKGILTYIAMENGPFGKSEYSVAMLV